MDKVKESILNGRDVEYVRDIASAIKSGWEARRARRCLGYSDILPEDFTFKSVKPISGPRQIGRIIGIAASILGLVGIGYCLFTREEDSGQKSVYLHEIPVKSEQGVLK